MNPPANKMEDEIYNLMKVWIIAITSAIYCYTLSKATRKGILRMILIIPIIFIFTIIPFLFSLTSIHLGVPTFFYLVWLGNFKLILFGFDLGPLPPFKDSLPHFICTLLLPIKPVVDPKARKKGSDVAPGKKTEFGRWVLFGVKFLVLYCVIKSYKYRKSMCYGLLLGLHCIHLYLGLEMILAVSGALARVSLGLDFAPQFNEPYLTTSLQDFWGQRWNLMVSDVLRMTVHNPIRKYASPVIGRKKAMVVGIVASFLVSGLMHELIYYFVTRVSPTWEVTCFFILHGVCTAIEVIVKKAVSNKWRVHRVISGPLTIGFVVFTGFWLFFTQIFRNEVHEKLIDEYPIMVHFFKRNLFFFLL